MNIEHLTELDKAATPGPWEVEEGFDGGFVMQSADPEPLNLANEDGEFRLRDAELIVALRNAAPEMLAVVTDARRLSAEIARDGTFDLGTALGLHEALRALDATGGGE